MQRDSDNAISKKKVAVLSMAALGLLFSSPCTVGDIGQDIISGTLSFVRGYTDDVWTELIPPADEIFGETEEEDDEED